MPNNREDFRINIQATGTDQAAAGVADVEKSVDNLASTASAAPQSINSVAGAIDTLKDSASGLLATFALLSIINTAIRWFTRLAEVATKAYAAFREYTGFETVAQQIDRVAERIDGLADSYKRLIEQAQKYTAEASQDTSSYRRSITAANAAANARVDLALQRSLAGVTDPAQRAILIAQASATKDIASHNIQVDLADREVADIDAAIARHQNTLLQARRRQNRAQTQVTRAEAARDRAQDTLSSTRSWRRGDKVDDLAKAEDTLAKARTLFADLSTGVAQLERQERLLLEARQAAADERTAAGLNAAAARQRAGADVQEAARRQAEAANAAARKAEEDARKKAAAEAAAADALAQKRLDIQRRTEEKIAAITVDSPRAASVSGAIGGIMGGSVQNAAQLQAQRADRIEALTREQTRLLDKIATNTED